MDKNYYTGWIRFYAKSGKASVEYDDGDEELLHLTEEIWYIIKAGTGEIIPSGLISKPRIVECKRDKNSSYSPVFDYDPQNSRNIKFKLPSNIEPSISSPCELWFPDFLLEVIALHSNEYAKAQHLNRPERLQHDIDLSEIGLVVSFVYYMDVFKFPDKDDYWSTQSLFPSNPPMQKMPRDRFK